MLHHFREDVPALEHGQQLLKDRSEVKTAENAKDITSWGFLQVDALNHFLCYSQALRLVSRA